MLVIGVNKTRFGIEGFNLLPGNTQNPSPPKTTKNVLSGKVIQNVYVSPLSFNLIAYLMLVFYNYIYILFMDIIFRGQGVCCAVLVITITITIFIERDQLLHNNYILLKYLMLNKVIFLK